MPIRSRIAPTPSGYLHIGNALNFACTWLLVRKQGGKLRLRIDDRDTVRSKPEYVEDIFRTLDWMGLDWDEGPQTPDEQERFYSQALRGDRYDEIVQELIKSGKVFACNCSRKTVHHHVCTCRTKNISLNHPDTALRIVTPTQPVAVHDLVKGEQFISLENEMKDFVIRRRDGITAYQLFSLTDDVDFDINLIVRGEDLLSSTAAQLYLATLLPPNNFAQTTFYHHSLLHDETGKKLSKSAGSLSLKTMREQGTSAAQLYIALSTMLRLKDKCTSLNQMLSVPDCINVAL
jgi:glutamyl/glutaminyl-tRNA synthetase